MVLGGLPGVGLPDPAGYWWWVVSSGVVISAAPSSMRPIAVRIVREAMAAQASGDSLSVAASIRGAWSGWQRVDKLRLCATFAWLAGYAMNRIPDPQERDALLSFLEEL